MAYYVDVPNHLDPEMTWIQQAEFETEAEAIAYAKKWYDADDRGRIQLVTWAEDEEESWDDETDEAADEGD